jgi:hypothetical protein
MSFPLMVAPIGRSMKETVQCRLFAISLTSHSVRTLHNCYVFADFLFKITRSSNHGELMSLNKSYVYNDVTVIHQF